MNEPLDLFGNKIIYMQPSKKRKQKKIFDDYESFVDKFKSRKTTDDCYTPPEVYNCVLNYVLEKCNIKESEIVRPFYPGGDYENCEYPDGCVVIDNPPFSIIAKIARFYIKNNVKFFLFAPHLTLFSSSVDCTRIVCGASIIYENGAKVKTSFISNLFGNIAIMSDYNLYKRLEYINDSNKVNLPKYEYPPHVLTVSMVYWCLERGISMKFDKQQIRHVSELDDQKKYKKSIFGGGYLLSEKATVEKAAAEKAAIEKMAAEKENIITWELSRREMDIVKSLE